MPWNIMPDMCKPAVGADPNTLLNFVLIASN